MGFNLCLFEQSGAEELDTLHYGVVRSFRVTTLCVRPAFFNPLLPPFKAAGCFRFCAHSDFCLYRFVMRIRRPLEFLLLGFRLQYIQITVYSCIHVSLKFFVLFFLFLFSFNHTKWFSVLKLAPSSISVVFYLYLHLFYIKL